MAKLAALVPAPRAHLTRFHGILAPAAKWRLTYKYQGRNFRLTDTAGRVVQKALTFDAGRG